MCGEYTRWTGMPCARQTGGIKTCHHHTRSRYIVSIVRLDTKDWAIYSLSYFLVLDQPDAATPPGIKARTNVSRLWSDPNIHEMYAITKTHMAIKLCQDDMIETFGKTRRRNRIVRSNGTSIDFFALAVAMKRPRFMFGLRPKLPDWIVMDTITKH